MTDTPRAPDDEIVSAYLDGQATAPERARIEQDPAARTRLDAFAAVRAEVAAPVAAPPGALDTALAAALATFDEQRATTTATTATTATPSTTEALDATTAMPTWITDAPTSPGADSSGPRVGSADGVMSLADRRRPPAARRFLSVAAAVVVLLGIGVVIRTAAQGSRDATVDQALSTPATVAAPQEAGTPAADQPDASTNGKTAAGPLTTLAPPTTAARNAAAASGPPTSVASTVAPSAPASGAGPPSPSVSEQATATDGAPAVVDLGAVASPAALRTSVASALAGEEPPPSDPSGAPSGPALAQLGVCDAGLRSQDREITTPRLRATATYAGTPAFVIVYDVDQQRFPATNGPLRLYTVDAGSCRVLDVQTL